MNIKVNFVPFALVKNTADILTRVKKSWLSSVQDNKYRYICSAGVSLKNVNNLNYMGVENTIFLARKRNPKISRKSAKKVVRSCVRC